MDARLCLDCDTKLLGRADKKYCNEACRNNHNNKLNCDITNQIRNTNNLLRKNRRILEELVKEDEGKVTVSFKKLNTLGFNFEYMTRMQNTQAGNTYFFCYEYGYKKLEGDFVLVVSHLSDEIIS